MIAGGEIAGAPEIETNQIQPASLDLQARQGRLPHSGELPARARRHRARQARRAQVPRDRPHQGRGARSGLRLSRAADRAAQAPLDHRRLRQSEKLDRAARRVHPADRRPAGRVRQRRGGLFGPALRRDLPAHLLDQGPLRLAAESDQVSPPRRPAARRRRAAGPGRRPAFARDPFRRRPGRGRGRDPRRAQFAHQPRADSAVRSRRLSRAALRRRDRCRRDRRLRRRSVSGRRCSSARTAASCSTRTSSTFSPRRRACRCRRPMSPRWRHSIR